MDSINTLAGPVNAPAFVDESSRATGAAVMAEVAQLVSKTNEVIDGLTEVAGDLDSEVAARGLAIAAVQAADAVLTSGLSDLSNIVQALDGRVEDAEYTVALLNAEILAGHTEVASGDLVLTAATERTVNFTGTAGVQNLTLGPTMTDFVAGTRWTIACNNADGVQISSSNWAHSALTGGVANLNLLVGDMAIVSVVSVGGTKKWSAAKLAGGGGYRAAPAEGGDLGAVDEDDRYIWVDRTGDTGTRDLYLPELGAATGYTNSMREFSVVLYGTPGSGTFVIHCQGTDTFINGATTHTMAEKSVCRLIGNDSGKWAVLVGKDM